MQVTVTAAVLQALRPPRRRCSHPLRAHPVLTPCCFPHDRVDRTNTSPQSGGHHCGRAAQVHVRASVLLILLAHPVPHAAAAKRNSLCARGAGGFDPLSTPRYVPPADLVVSGPVSTAAVPGSVQAAAAIDASFKDGCHVGCAAPIAARDAGFGAWLNSYVAGQRHAFLHGWRGAPLKLHTALESRLPPRRLRAALCPAQRNWSLGCLLRHADGYSGASCAGKPLPACSGHARYDWERRYVGDAPEASVAATFPGFNAVPGKYAGSRAEHKRRRETLRSGGSFWSLAHTTARLLAPSDRFAAAIEDERRAIGLAAAPRPTLALHIRHGDACKDTRRFRTCSNTSEYAHEAARLGMRYGFRSIFAMSDSDAAMRQLPRALRAAGWPADGPVLMRRDTSRSSKKRSMPIESAMSQGVIEPWSELVAFLSDVHLAAGCDGFVGKFTGNLDRIAYALMAARSNCAPVYVSLDAAWCFGSRGWSPGGVHRKKRYLARAPPGSFGCGP